jgi:hypothetical protein
MYEKESELVTQFLIEQIETYNICLGGKLTPKYFTDRCKVINEFGKVFIAHKNDNRLLTNEIVVYKVKRNCKKKKQPNDKLLKPKKEKIVHIINKGMYNN